MRWSCCDSRLPILLQLLIYVGHDMKVACIESIKLMVYEIHTTEILFS